MINNLQVNTDTINGKCFKSTGVVAMDAGDDMVFIINQKASSQPIPLFRAGDLNLVHEENQYEPITRKLKEVFQMKARRGMYAEN